MLQAYATQMALDYLGYKNETIDISGFQNELNRAKYLYFAKASFSSGFLPAKAGMAVNAFMKRFSRGEYAAQSRCRSQTFSCFQKEHFRFSPRYDSKKALREQCEKRYETMVVGSDQLWLPGNIAADYYTLNFVPESVNTVACATSFGQSTLPRDSAKKASHFLRRIRHLSVREESGQKLVKELTGRNVPVVCDPVLLFSADTWKEVEKEIFSEHTRHGPYIFCYFLGHNTKHRAFAKHLRAETGYRIVTLPHLDEYVRSDEEYADEKFYCAGPGQFIRLIRCASYVCTDSFHCSAFALLYERPLFPFRRYAGKTKLSTNSRLDTLFRLSGADVEILKGDEDIRKCLAREKNGSRAAAGLEAFREYSWNYLQTALWDEVSTDL